MMFGLLPGWAWDCCAVFGLIVGVPSAMVVFALIACLWLNDDDAAALDDGADEADVDDWFAHVTDAMEREHHVARHHRDRPSLEVRQERQVVADLDQFRRRGIKAVPSHPPVNGDAA